MLVGIAVSTPVILGIATQQVEIGLSLCFGAIWCSPSDTSGSLKNKQIGILFSSFLVVIVSFIGGYLNISNFLLFPILGFLTFCIAFISIYGFRASLISFSGLLALILSFAHISKHLEVYQYALLIGGGGLWYLSLSTVWHYINPKAQTKEILTETFLLTAEFLNIRRQLIGEQPDRVNLQKQLITLQSELTEHHDTLREILIISRKNSGKSNYQNKRLLVFVLLVEILETAIANPVNYHKMDALFAEHPELKTDFQKLIEELSRQLSVIAQNDKSQQFPSNNILTEKFKTLKEDVIKLKSENRPENYERYLMLQNLLDYQNKQIEKLKKIKWLLGNPVLTTEDLVNNDKLKRFIVSPDYDPKLVLENLSFKSTIFKHSLRLAVTVMLGYAIGLLFDFQNPYWIMLTIIVIMRPSYGLTKKRSKDRTIGTLIGAALASVLVFLIKDPYIFGTLAVVSLIIAFSMVQKNYKATATFITLSVIFIYAILKPNVLQVIQFRVIDTIIGAVLSFITMRWLWPAWSFMEIGENIKDALKANMTFFESISKFYKNKGPIPTSLKVNRKEAFVQMSNLSSTFQRMAQEPQSKQTHIDDIYELVVLNHSFLSSLASIYTYIQNHNTTKASEDFISISDRIESNINTTYKNLNLINFEVLRPKKESQKAKPAPFNFSVEHFTNIAISQSNNESTHREVHLIWEQLYWLFSLSEKMLKLTSKYKTDNFTPYYF
ncbi:FUSC family protein [Winogradskyella undariae]|uniref:FUSC family protein n=1 Tax=Winogradskyella undariae TaxID=1285465 RepID=UPI00156B06ED|nr:FUSC family membrane protein [Winogradskyella undariae]NRR90990.1 FUSC family protein [Winogradskyella undariae]